MINLSRKLPLEATEGRPFYEKGGNRIARALNAIDDAVTRTGLINGGRWRRRRYQIQPWVRARWAASCRLAAPSLVAAEER
jgi:hypothetical protein